MTWNKLDFNFYYNFKKNRALFAYFWEEYLRVDFKYLIKPSILLFISLLVFVYYGFLLQNFTMSTPENYTLFSFQGTIVLNVIFFFWSAHFLNRTVYSKAFHIYQWHNNPQFRYKENLGLYHTSPVKYSQRPHVSLFISFLLGICVNFLYFYISYSGIIGRIFGFNKNLSGLVSFLYFLEIGPILVTGLLFMIPFKQFLALLRSNKYIYSLNKNYSFSLFEGWKNKIKFLLLELICINILGIVLEVLFYAFLILVTVVLGILAIVIIVILIGLISFLSLATISYRPLALLGSVIIIFFVFCFSCLFVVGVELEGSLIGTLYGQTYINLTNPNLEDVQIKKPV